MKGAARHPGTKLRPKRPRHAPHGEVVPPEFKVQAHVDDTVDGEDQALQIANLAGALDLTVEGDQAVLDQPSRSGIGVIVPPPTPGVLPLLTPPRSCDRLGSTGRA